MPSNKKLLQAAAGNAGESLYVEDVFSTYLYEGNATARSINNGVDLTEGGLVWAKSRTSTYDHQLFDTETGVGKYLVSNSTSDAAINAQSLTSFNSNGFSLGTDWTNAASQNYASWTFRKAEKFFDVVAYTGDGVDGRQLPHSLGSTPGMVVCKRTDTGQYWILQHKSLDLSGNKTMYLNVTSPLAVANDYWNSTHASSTAITLSGDADINGSGGTYVAYVFASDAGGFGDDGSESIIKCGTYGPGTETLDGPEVNLGWEPQWILTKSYDNTGDWVLHDNMRGVVTNGNDKWVRPNTSGAELTSENIIFTATGFKITSLYSYVNQSGKNYIYMAIRRPMKTPAAGTEVFATDTRGSTGDGKAPTYRSPWPVDMQFNRNRTYAGGDTQISARMLQGTQLWTNLTTAESSNASMMFDYMNGVQTDTGTSTSQSAWMFKRATGFMDVAAYTGTGNFPQNVTHNLTVTPEMMIVKYRDGSSNWYVYHSALGNTKICQLDNDTASSTSGSAWDNTSPTATQFTVGSLQNYPVAGKFIAYLFATLAGVSKVGSYTGTEADLNVDCGFSAGARFILIKRTDSTGNWYYWDSARGIVAGNDPYLLLNTTAAEVTHTDYIDPLSSGFTVTSLAPSALNASGGTYLFLAIA